MTKRTSGLSTPMPKAMVATITAPSSARNRSSRLSRSAGAMPA